MDNSEGPIPDHFLRENKKVKAVPNKSSVIQFVPIKKGLENLKKIKKDLEDGKIEHAIVLYRRDGEDYYMPLTDSSYETFGWMMQKAMIAMAVEDDAVNDDQ